MDFHFFQQSIMQYTGINVHEHTKQDFLWYIAVYLHMLKGNQDKSDIHTDYIETTFTSFTYIIIFKGF